MGFAKKCGSVKLRNYYANLAKFFRKSCGKRSESLSQGSAHFTRTKVPDVVPCWRRLRNYSETISQYLLFAIDDVSVYIFMRHCHNLFMLDFPGEMTHALFGSARRLAIFMVWLHVGRRLTKVSGRKLARNPFLLMPAQSAF
ncbi:hypothetical protein PGT21_019254 [Puccinia graminis f. sp. tritici]|uniref:Uncharacterized protein n=1 Tax=Puccinia graminis f. sp. tritici TaxID=56615 RepID=A0A5B0RM83_PUCGR|nr:hypothetical protein PGT21_019254 [Puccinia graminis f. sp. tritici]KAA1126003.1 hypothetical protein PGTUg99_010206 [Puccinia graminis f. sp. tritici]